VYPVVSRCAVLYTNCNAEMYRSKCRWFFPTNCDYRFYCFVCSFDGVTMQCVGEGFLWLDTERVKSLRSWLLPQIAVHCPILNPCIETSMSVYYLLTQLLYDHGNCDAAKGTEFHPFSKSVLHDLARYARRWSAVKNRRDLASMEL